MGRVCEGPSSGPEPESTRPWSMMAISPAQAGDEKLVPPIWIQGAELEVSYES